MDLVEPTDPAERGQAIRICRANAHLDIDTCRALSPDESRKQWKALKDLLPSKKWLWMWNYGQDEWNKRAVSAEGNQK